MSAEAQGWVFRHSPFRGATFTVHLALGDSANDQNDFRLWMSMATLGEKARVDPGSSRRALKQLLDEGFVELLKQGNGTTNLYRFLFPDCAVIYDTRRRSTPVDNPLDEDDGPRAPRATPRAPDATPPGTTRADPAHHARLTQEEPKRNPNRTTASRLDERDDEPLPSTEIYALTRTGEDLAPPVLDLADRKRGLDQIRANRDRRRAGRQTVEVSLP